MTNKHLIAFIIYLLLSFKFAYAIDSNTKTIANIYGQDITFADIEPNPIFVKYEKRNFPELPENEILENMRKRNFHTLIWKKLNQSLVQQYNLTPTAEEVERYLKAVKLPVSSGVSEEVKIEIKKANLILAKDAIKRFKISKRLYQEYGGTVIFQQTNPYEPISAYRQFLEEQENQNQLKIYNDEYRTTFWQYYLTEHPFKVKKNKVDFSMPWWEKKLNKME